jgi:hypothetical protein
MHPVDYYTMTLYLLLLFLRVVGFPLVPVRNSITRIMLYAVMESYRNFICCRRMCSAKMYKLANSEAAPEENKA